MADKLTAEQIAALAAEKAAKEARKAELKAKRDAEREQRAGESKADAFKRIATRRTNGILDALGAMRGLSNKTNYEYTDELTGKILAAIRAGVDKLEADFKAGGVRRSESGFDL